MVPPITKLRAEISEGTSPSATPSSASTSSWSYLQPPQQLSSHLPPPQEKRGQQTKPRKTTNQKENKNKPKDTIYRRSIVAIDIDSSFQVRKGLDIFQATSPNQLRYDNEYFIRLNCSNTEKERSEAILKRKKFEVDKIFYN